MRNYDELSKEELIQRLKDKEYMLEEIKNKTNQEELLNFPWAGNLGHWHWNVKSDELVCNDKKITTLNYTKDEIPKDLGFEFFTSKLHPDDYENVMDNMRQHIEGKTGAYEVEYRIQTKEGNYKWYYDIGRVTKRDEDNKPYFICGIVFDITEKKEIERTIIKQNKKLLKMVNIDDLTEIYNRKALYRKLEEEILISDKEKTKLSIIMMDLDKFSKINDNYGHLTGDHVIRKTAKIIKDTLPEKGFVGRYGGEEYLIVLPECDKNGAYDVAEKIRKNIENEEFESGIKITISGGIREYDHKEPLYTLIDKSDTNLYKAKDSGRNRIVMD